MGTLGLTKVNVKRTTVRWVVWSFCLLGASGVEAQLVVGARGGVNLAQVLGGNVPTQTRTGLNIGSFVTVPFTSDFALQPEVAYSEKGGAQLPLGAGGQPVFDYLGLDVDYLEIGLLGRFASVGAEAIPFLVIGPVISLVARCKASPTGDEAFAERPCDDPTIENPTDPRNVDLAGLVAGGVEIVRGRASLQVDVRFQLGLLPFDRSGPVGVANRRNRVLSINLGLGYRMPSVRAR